MNAFQRIREAVAAVVFLTSAANAQWFDQGAVFIATEENDAVVDRDEHYTQGIKLAYLHTDNAAPDWLKRCADVMPAWGYTPRAIKIGAQIGQNIYTPKNQDTTQWLPDDRPYAGWLYTGFIVQRRGLTGGGRPAFESFQADIGVVGPPSLAEDAQRWVHTDPPKGWNNQINTEPGVALKYYRSWLFSSQRAGPRSFDFIPHAGFSLGNIDTSFRVGATIRAGWNLPDDFGPQTINALATTAGGRSAQENNGRWGLYFFGDAEGRAVAYNEFLNGNMFRSSHHVTPETLVGELRGGGVLLCNRAEIGAALVCATDEFKGQKRSDVFGTVYLKIKM